MRCTYIDCLALDAAARHTALHTVHQGSAAGIVKPAMLQLKLELAVHSSPPELSSLCSTQVHLELV